MSAENSLVRASGSYQASDRMAGARPPILAVLVLYQVEPSSSLTLTSFLRALDESGLAGQFKLLIYDNSPSESVLPGGIPVPITYIHDPSNGGLFRAYTAALQKAEREGNEWLLLLDQDTVLDAGYLKTLWFSLPEAAGNLRCAVLAPKLLSKNKVISPARVLWGGRLLPVDKTLSGISPWEIMALNSGTLLRISAIREIGGFNPVFWLDYLDHWLFNRLHRAGYSMYVLDAALPHELSVRNLRGMSTARYRNILLAEGEFYQCCKSQAENRVYLLRLVLRAVKMLVRSGGRKLFPLTLNHLVSLACQKRSSTAAATRN